MRVKEVCLFMLVLLIGLIGLVLVSGVSSAATDDVAFVSEQLYVANVMVGQNDGRDLVVNFDLINETDFIQPDLRYAVILGQEYQDGLVKMVDWKKADEVVTVGAQEKLNKTIEYIAPDHLTGDYLVGIEVVNSSGHIFGLVYGKKVSFSKENVLIKLENCLWQVEDISGVKNGYDSGQSVLINQDDTLYASCEVVNDGEQTLTMNPVFSWHWRQIFGDEMKTDFSVEEQLNIVPGKNNIIVKTPKPIDWKPQAYDMVLYLTGGNGLVKTNQQALLAVVGGLSATIDNVCLNKNNYAKGETAQVEVRLATSG